MDRTRIRLASRQPPSRLSPSSSRGLSTHPAIMVVVSAYSACPANLAETPSSLSSLSLLFHRSCHCSIASLTNIFSVRAIVSTHALFGSIGSLSSVQDMVVVAVRAMASGGRIVIGPKYCRQDMPPLSQIIPTLPLYMHSACALHSHLF